MKSTKLGVAVLLCLGTTVLIAGCDDPKKPQTWIKKLRDPEHGPEAVRQLQLLGDPVAVEPLCELFKDYPSANILKAIISFKDRRAIPTLRAALDFTEDNYTNATRAANALADFKASEAVPDLIKVLKRPLPIKSRANLAKQAAIEALAKIGDKKAVPALIEVADGRAEKQDFYLNKVAVVALGMLRDVRAVPVLIRALFLSSTLQGSSFSQATVALARVGLSAVHPLIRAMQGKDPQLNAMAKELEFRPGVVRSKTAIVLGNLGAKQAVSALLAELAAGGHSGPKAVGLEGVIEALGEIGEPGAVRPLLALVQDDKADPRLRIKACRALTFLGGKQAAPVLLALAEKGYVEGGLWDLRVESAMAYSRSVAEGADEGVRVLTAVLKDDKVQKLAAYARVRQIFADALVRTQLAVKCKADVQCYAESLSEQSAPLPVREKSAIMIGLLPDGRKALDVLVKALPSRREPGLRQFMLESAKRIGRSSDAQLITTLHELAAKDSKRRAKFLGADLGRYDNIALALISRKQ